jgi:hypothetical protein
MVPPPLPPRRNYTVKGNQKLVYQSQGMQLSTVASAATAATTAATAAATAAANAATIAVIPSASIASYHNALGTDTIAVMPATSNTASYYNNGVLAVASIGANTNSSAIGKSAASSTSLANATGANNRSWGHGVSLRGIPTSYLI